MQGLRTISPHEAKLQAKIEAAKLDAYWTQMRLARSGVLGLSLIRDGIDVRDPFVGVDYDRSKSVVTPKPIPINDLRRVQRECMQIDDDIRWLVVLISDTGMRLAEAAGLSVSYFNLQGDIPFVEVRPRPWRSLKTSASARVIPLSGMALWAAQRILQKADASSYAFPRYDRGSRTRANSASAAINKWLKNYVPEGCTMHSFRHSMRDRLRAVQCPADIADQIGGWATDGVGQSYGSGYLIDVVNKWVEKALVGLD